MSLDTILNDILISSVREKTAEASSSASSTTEKVASLNLNSDEAAGLIKLSNLVREVSIEPTYKDLYTFVGGLYGRR